MDARIFSDQRTFLLRRKIDDFVFLFKISIFNFKPFRKKRLLSSRGVEPPILRSEVKSFIQISYELYRETQKDPLCKPVNGLAEWIFFHKSRASC